MDEQPRYRTHISLAEIQPSPTNPRKHFDEAGLAELAISIKEHGVITPILIRVSDQSEHMYELISGERRWRAAQIAGLRTIPAVIRDDLSPSAIIEIQLIENLQRQDLHPLEEAEGYGRMMREHGYTADTLAEKIGKSRSYIFGRMKLLALSEEGRRLFYGGLLNPSTALLVARIPTHKLQAKAIDDITSTNYYGEPKSVREAQRWIRDRYMLKLTEAPFPLADAALIATAGACVICPKRTGNEPELFDDIDSPDVCTDPDCYVAKKIAHRDREAEKVIEQGGKVILGDDAKKIAPHGQYGLKGYTSLQDKCYDDPDHRTYAEILGDEAEATLLEDTSRQTLMPVLENKVLAEKLQAAGVKLRAQEEAKGKKRVDAKLKLERLTRERLFLQVRSAWKEMIELPRAAFAFQEMNILFGMITGLLWERLYSDIKPKLTALWGAEGKNQTERETSFEARLLSMTTPERWQLLVDILTISGQNVDNEWDLERGGKTLMKTAELFGIDIAETRKDVAFEEKAREKAAEHAEKPAKKSKKTAPATSEDHLPPTEAAQARGDFRAEEQAGATEAAQAGDQTPLEKATAEKQSSAAGAAVEKPSPDQRAFHVGDIVHVLNVPHPDHGLRPSAAGKGGPIETIFFDERVGVMIEGEELFFHPCQLEVVAYAEAIESDAKPSPARKHSIEYQHPENAELCWSGRGRKPKWVEHWIAGGKTLDQLKIGAAA